MQIQQQAIPLIKEGKDLIGMSKTGSGKTLAFGLPLLETITRGRGLQVLILTPTRELAVQISSELSKAGKYLPCRIATTYGGVSLEPQIREMARAEIVVATPGRMRDHLLRRNVDLSAIKCLVLDEADKMVEMGFIEDVEDLLRATPEYRQILLFGATLSKEIDYLRSAYMRQPAVAEAELHVQEDLLQQYYYNVQPFEKFSLLVHLLKKEESKQVIIFCSSRSTVEVVNSNLRKQGFDAAMIHGKLSQNTRLRIMADFNRGKPNILVASAVAARGLDIKYVTHVFNYDLSQDSQEYIHRVGRTARAGETGKAITLLCHKDYGVFQEVLNRYPVTVEELPSEQFPRVRFEFRPQNRFGFRDGKANHHFQGRGSSYPRRWGQYPERRGLIPRSSTPH